MKTRPRRQVISANQHETRVRYEDFVEKPEVYLADASKGRRVVIEGQDDGFRATILYSKGWESAEEF